jgi:hypothetical protein
MRKNAGTNAPSGDLIFGNLRTSISHTFNPWQGKELLVVTHQPTR